VWYDAHAVGLVRPYVLEGPPKSEPVMLCWRGHGYGRRFTLPIVVESNERASQLVRLMHDELGIDPKLAQVFDGERAPHTADKLFAEMPNGDIEPRNALESAMEEALSLEPHLRRTRPVASDFESFEPVLSLSSSPVVST
jgi:hypothetical protein